MKIIVGCVVLLLQIGSAYAFGDFGRLGAAGGGGHVSSGVSPPWTPLDLGSALAAWWDAQSGVVLSGSNITTWTDRKSGIVLSPSGTPTFSATARNGKPGVILNGSAQFLFSPASPGVDATPTAFSTAVAAFSNSSAFQVLLSWNGTNATPGKIREIGTDPAYFDTNGGLTSGNTWNGVDKFMFAQADGVSTLLAFENGNAVPFTASYTPVAGDGTESIFIGIRSGIANYWNGVVQQAFIIAGNITSGQRQGLEGWESWYDGKAGANLPSGHPYKSAPPTQAQVAAAGSSPAGLPLDVAASGIITQRTFFDDFTSLSTIDTTDTGAAGFNWYVHRAWPAAASPFGAWASVVSSTPTPAANISVASSLLTLSDYPGGTTGMVISSAVRKVGGGFNGTAFGGGGYFEASMAFNPALALSGMASWPAFWSTAVEFLVGSATHFVEPDMFEAIPTGTGAIQTLMALHDWDNVALTNNAQQISPSIGSPVFTAQHKYGLWWVPASKNGGTGVIRRYFDGAFVGQTNYSATAGGAPTFGPANPAGVFSEIDSQHLILNLSCGPSWPAIFDSVSVWQ